MHRVAITGPCGAGKSTLAIELGRRTGLPVFHMDRLFWKPGWVESSREELTVRVAELIDTHEKWIIDGNYSGTFEQRLAVADTIIFLDLPPRVYRWRVLKRCITGYGRSRPDMTEGCPERLDREFLWYVLSYHSRHRSRHVAKIESFVDRAEIITLRSPREVREFLASFPSHER